MSNNFKKLVFDLRFGLTMYYLNDFSMLYFRNLLEYPKGSSNFANFAIAFYLLFSNIRDFLTIYSIGEEHQKLKAKTTKAKEGYKKTVISFLKEEMNETNWQANQISKYTNLFFFLRFYLVYIALVSFQVFPKLQILGSFAISICFAMTFFCMSIYAKNYKNVLVFILRLIFEIILALILWTVYSIWKGGEDVLKKSKFLVSLIGVGLVNELIYCFGSLVYVLVTEIIKLNKKKSKRKVTQKKVKKSSKRKLGVKVPRGLSKKRRDKVIEKRRKMKKSQKTTKRRKRSMF